MMYLLIRIVLIGLVIWFGVRLLRKWRQDAGLAGPPKEPKRFEPTTRCPRCGVHLPASAVSPTGLCGKCSG
ncbi:MAG: hypothetical protein ACT4PZ_02535 [Panacagrimonas sp.]